MEKKENHFISKSDRVDHLFKKPEHPYLLSHSVGLQTNEKKLVNTFFHSWETCGGNAWEDWLKIIKNFCTHIAKLLNTEDQNICPQSNLSSALTKVIGAMEQEKLKNKTILVSEHDFPSLVHVVKILSKRHYNIKIIPKSDPVNQIATWEKHLDKKVAVVLITHATSHTGQLAPINEITKITRDKNIFSIIDVAQSIGIKKIDLKETKADCLIGSCVKWLCGGPGAGFLWLEENKIDQLKPQDFGWFSQIDPFNYDLENFSYATDAKKFWGGTPSVLPYAIAGDALQVLLEIGIKKIISHNEKLTNLLIEKASANKDQVINPYATSKRSASVIVKCQKNSLFLKSLKDKKYIFDTCPNGIRLSPHIYNHKDDILML